MDVNMIWTAGRSEPGPGISLVSRHPAEDLPEMLARTDGLVWVDIPHWDEEAQEIVFYERVQLGIAAATPRGLMVPKIRDADLLGLRELATALTELTEKARGGTTTPKELVGGTITITNVGVFGVDTGTPILNPGESAILALGAVKQAPWVVDGALAVRTVCHLALSFDHRVVDGEQGSRFLADVGALLSDPGLAMTY